MKKDGGVISVWNGVGSTLGIIRGGRFRVSRSPSRHKECQLFTTHSRAVIQDTQVYIPNSGQFPLFHSEDDVRTPFFVPKIIVSDAYTFTFPISGRFALENGHIFRVFVATSTREASLNS